MRRRIDVRTFGRRLATVARHAFLLVGCARSDAAERTLRAALRAELDRTGPTGPASRRPEGRLWSAGSMPQDSRPTGILSAPAGR